MDIRDWCRTCRLCDATGFTVNMAILDGADVVYIERCRTSRSGQREIDLNLHVGSRLPVLHRDGQGAARLRPAERLEEILDRVELARGPNTITNRDAPGRPRTHPELDWR